MFDFIKDMENWIFLPTFPPSFDCDVNKIIRVIFFLSYNVCIDRSILYIFDR